MDKSLKRVSLMIREEQYEALAKKDLNLSGLVRDMIDDYLSQHKITIAVSESTKDLYDRIVSNTGSTDSDVEMYLKQALKHLLQRKISEMEELHKTVFKD